MRGEAADQTSIADDFTRLWDGLGFAIPGVEMFCRSADVPAFELPLVCGAGALGLRVTTYLRAEPASGRPYTVFPPEPCT
jgi:hypothetical protein